MAVSAAPVATTAIKAAFTNFNMAEKYDCLVLNVTPLAGCVFKFVHAADGSARGTNISANGTFATNISMRNPCQITG